jgi:hypothetical protein
MPVAAGAAIACPQRKVIVLEGDGSAMYTLQSLWTMAREGLNVTTLIFSDLCERDLQYLAWGTIERRGRESRAACAGYAVARETRYRLGSTRTRHGCGRFACSNM